MSRYLHTPSEIAAALRTIAARLDAMAPTVLPDLAVDFNIQVCAWSTADVDARVAAVDALTLATTATPAETRQMTDGSWMHWIPCTDDRLVDGVQVSVYGSVPAPAAAELTPAG